MYALDPLNHFNLDHHLRFDGHTLPLICCKTYFYIIDAIGHFTHDGDSLMVSKEMNLAEVVDPPNYTIM